MQHYRRDFYNEVQQKIQNKNTDNTAQFNAVQKALYSAAAVPIGLNIEELENPRRLMNKIMMKYIEQVRMEPTVYIKDRSWH